MTSALAVVLAAAGLACALGPRSPGSQPATRCPPPTARPSTGSPTAAASSPDIGDSPLPFPRFTIRGRLDPADGGPPAGADLPASSETDKADRPAGRPELLWMLRPTEDRAVDDRLQAALEAALETWRQTGHIRSRPARLGETATFELSQHGAEQRPRCRPFGQDRSVAHTGPVGPGNFIHLDDDLARGRAGDDGQLLRRTIAHEIGHVLGLDHVTDIDALMHPDSSRDGPGASELAGLASLYGGGQPGPGDLAVTPGRAGPELSLRGVASPGSCEWCLFDSDGDGDQEILVWRTDRAGLGALMIYHYAPGPRLARSVGPLLGAVPPEARASAFETGTDGARWLLSVFPDGSTRVRRFDSAGVPRAARPTEQQALQIRAGSLAGADRPRHVGPRTGDLDGDGFPETVRRGSTELQERLEAGI